MGWYAVVSLLTDSRVRFLMGFIIFAVILAIILISIEIFLKEKEQDKKKKVEQTPTDRLSIYINSNKSVQDKLEFMDKMAKEYFRDMYDFPLTSSYSFLIKKLANSGNKIETLFCEKMFETFYSKKELDKNIINGLFKILVEIEKNRIVDKNDKYLEKIPSSVSQKMTDVKLVVKESNIKLKVLPEEFKIHDKLKKENKPEEKKLLNQETIGAEVEKEAAEEELRTKKRLEVLAKKEAEERRREAEILEMKIESEKRIKERKILVDERLKKLAISEEEKKRKETLARKDAKERMDKKRDLFWKEKQEKESEIKLREEKVALSRKLELERKEQERKEQLELKSIKLEQKTNERKGLTQLEKKEMNKIDAESEGIAEKIVRIERERLGLEGYKGA
jgi:hypothetical protein